MPLFPLQSCRRRWQLCLAIAFLACASAGLTAYWYRRHQHDHSNTSQLQILAQQPLVHASITRPDWPQWRGPNRDGTATDTDLRAQWGHEGPKLLWERPAGAGHASVAIANGRLFTMLRENDEEAAVCWDAATGDEIWRYTYPCAYTNEHGNGPRSTPSVDGEFVFTVGAAGVMHCLKAFSDHAEVVWTKDLSREFQAPVPKWGVSFSPLVVGERIFIQPGGPNGNSLAALDKRTGKVLWSKHDDPASYSSPIATTFSGHPQVLFFTADRLLGVDPTSGEQLWSFDWPSDQQCNIATPVVVQEYVFISSAHRRGCAVLKIERTDDGWHAVLVYNHRRMRNHFSTCVRHKDHLYGFDHGILTCMDFRTGAICWKERGFDKGSILLVGDQLILYGENGVVALAATDPKRYAETCRFTFSAESAGWTVPVVVDGCLYLRDRKRLACFSVKSADH